MKKSRVLFILEVVSFKCCFEVIFVLNFERFAKKKFGLLFLKSVVDSY